MNMKRFRIVSFLLILYTMVFFCYCGRGPYAAANRSYKKQAKRFAKTIRQTPVLDSFSSSPWIGTTNFNLRKPNFVIIHHTAQNSCEQTFKPFTTVSTQVSA